MVVGIGIAAVAIYKKAAEKAAGSFWVFCKQRAPAARTNVVPMCIFYPAETHESLNFPTSHIARSRPPFPFAARAEC